MVLTTGRDLSSGSTPICKRGALDQIADHVILKCSLHPAPSGYHGFLILDDETQYWLNKIAANNRKGPPIKRSALAISSYRKAQFKVKNTKLNSKPYKLLNMKSQIDDTI